MATRLTQQQRSGPRPRYTNRHRRQTATLCDTTTRISRAYTPPRDTTRTQQTGSQSQHLCCLRGTRVHNGSRGNAQPNPEATIGAARAAHNRANSHGIRISHARRGRTVLQLDNVPGTARQHEPVPCHATCNRGGGIGLRQRACTCDLSPAAAPPPVGLSSYPLHSAISAGLQHASALLFQSLLSMASCASFQTPPCQDSVGPAVRLNLL